MKKISKLILITFLIVGIQSCAIVTYEGTPEVKVVQVEKENQNQLFVKANNWMVERFNNAESVIQFSDKESGTISGKYLLGTVTNPNEYGPGSKAWAMIKVQVKDNAARITITPDSFKYAKGNPYTLYIRVKKLIVIYHYC